MQQYSLRDIPVKDSSLEFHVYQTVGKTPIVPYPASDLREKIMDDTFIDFPEYFKFISTLQLAIFLTLVIFIYFAQILILNCPSVNYCGAKVGLL
jgi:hypothetical protein